MAAPIISRIAAYGLCPETVTPQRYVGTDDPFRLSLELLHITLDTGVEGIASTCSGWRRAPVGRIAAEAEMWAEATVGKSIEELQGQIAASGQGASDAELPSALAALLDVAIWDARTRMLARPLHRHLGARRDSLPAYASTPAYLCHESYLADVETALRLGCRAVKFHFNGDAAFDAALVETVAAEFKGHPIRFAADLEGVYGFEEAVEMAHLLVAHGYLWMEAPFPDDRLDLYAALGRETGIERVPPGYDRFGRDHWVAGLSMGAWSRLRFDVSLTGVTEGMIGASLAEKVGCPLELQSFGYMPAQAANFAVMLASPMCGWFELPLPVADFRLASAGGVEINEEGNAVWQQANGLGVVMDLDLVAEMADRSFSS